MSTIFVTGATGFLGREVLMRLLGLEGLRLRVLARPPVPSWLQRLPVDVVQGDIGDVRVLAQGCAGAELVYHLAGRVSRNPDDAHALHAIHVDGTRLLCHAARQASVRRIVLASTSGTIAVSEHAEPLADERSATPMGIIARWPYYASKLYQERVALEACAGGGPELVILNPSLLLGPGDERLSSTHDVLRFLQRDIPVVLDGGVNFVDVRDAAAAFVAAREHGRPGERYLLGGPNWTMAEFFARLERASKVAGPKLRLPRTLTLWGARIVDQLYRRVDKLPPVEFASVEMATYYWWLDDRKARAELGFQSRDPGETLYDTVCYIRARLLGRDAFGHTRARTGSEASKSTSYND